LFYGGLYHRIPPLVTITGYVCQHGGAVRTLHGKCKGSGTLQKQEEDSVNSRFEKETAEEDCKNGCTWNFNTICAEMTAPKPGSLTLSVTLQ